MDPTSETYFPETNFALKFESLVEYSKRIQAQKTYGYKIVPNKPYESSRHQLSCRKNFPKEFFHEICLINKECKFNHTAKIKLEKDYFVTI